MTGLFFFLGEMFRGLYVESGSVTYVNVFFLFRHEIGEQSEAKPRAPTVQQPLQQFYNTAHQVILPHQGLKTFEMDTILYE
jgi:hypothetical protein